MFEFNAKDLKVGHEFTTQADAGSVWFKVVEIDASHPRILDVLGEVVAMNPDVDYAVADSEWMSLDVDEKVIVR